MKMPATNLILETVAKATLNLRITPPVAPSHDAVVRFIHSKGRVHSHAIASWERLEAEVLQKYRPSTVTINSQVLFAKRTD